MGYSHCVLGDLSFPKAADATAWRKSVVDGSKFDSPAEWKKAPKGETVDEALARFGEEPALLERNGAKLKLRSVVDNDSDAYVEGRGSLANAFRQAASFGAKGSLSIVSYVDAPGTFGVRITVGDGNSSFETLDDAQVREIEESAAYAEAEELVQEVAAGADDFFARAMAAAEAKAAAATKAISRAANMDEVLKALPSLLPEVLTGMDKEASFDWPAVDALAARKDKDAGARLAKRLAELVGGPLATPRGEWKRELGDEELAEAGAIANALWKRVEAVDEVTTLWAESPHHFLRSHQILREIERPEVDKRLASLYGKDLDLRPESNNHRWVVEALFVTDPKGAPAKALALLEGDVRTKVGALESLRWTLAELADRDELNVPAWRKFVEKVVSAHPHSGEHLDPYDSLRDDAAALMAKWKMPEAMKLLTENLQAFGVVRVAELLAELGDPAAVPVMQEWLESEKDRKKKNQLKKFVTALGGEAAATKKPAKKKAAKKS